MTVERDLTVAPIGARFGKWTVTGFHSWTKLRMQRWSVRCDCGTEGTRYAASLKSGGSKSCGCPARFAAGTRFGRWTIIEESPKADIRRYFVVCDCGIQRHVNMASLVNGESLSCGCLAREGTSIRARTHGLTKTRQYRIWRSMRQRCLNPKVVEYSRYGGRGITICDRWRDSFEAFWEDMGPTYAPHLSIDRIDNDAGYAPGNCRWATSKQQAMNRSNTLVAQTPIGPMSVQSAAKLTGLSLHCIQHRVKTGKTGHDLVKPSQRPHSRKSVSAIATDLPIQGV